MDWLDFFFGMCIGAEICESEYEEELRNRYYDDFDEDDFKQYLYEKKLKRSLKWYMSKFDILIL